MHKEPSKTLSSFSFVFVFLISHANHLQEKVEAIHTADISHTLYIMSVKLALKYTLIIAWEKRQNSLYGRSHTYLLWVRNLKDKNGVKVTFLFRANRTHILEVSVYHKLARSSYYTWCFMMLCNLLNYRDFSVESCRNSRCRMVTQGQRPRNGKGHMLIPRSLGM